MKNYGVKSDKARDNLIGEVKITITKTFEIKDGIRELYDHIRREYNSDGIRIESIYYEHGDVIRLRQVTIFDEKGSNIGFANYNSNGLLDSYYKYELDHNDRIISKYFNGEIEETYKYEDNNNISETFSPNTGGRNYYEYDEKGFAIKQLSVLVINPIFGSLFGPERRLTTYINDHWGNIIEMKVYDEETNEIYFTQINTINKQGDEIESIEYEADGSVKSHVRNKYEYDNEGNWVSKKTMTGEGLVYREQTREIHYL